ncbi:MAG: hypothetical protein ACPGTG_00250 [Flavobacteriales bacterium]
MAVAALGGLVWATTTTHNCDNDATVCLKLYQKGEINPDNEDDSWYKRPSLNIEDYLDDKKLEMTNHTGDPVAGLQNMTQAQFGALLTAGFGANIPSGGLATISLSGYSLTMPLSSGVCSGTHLLTTTSQQVFDTCVGSTPIKCVHDADLLYQSSGPGGSASASGLLAEASNNQSINLFADWWLPQAEATLYNCYDRTDAYSCNNDGSGTIGGNCSWINGVCSGLTQASCESIEGCSLQYANEVTNHYTDCSTVSTNADTCGNFAGCSWNTDSQTITLDGDYWLNLDTDNNGNYRYLKVYNTKPHVVFAPFRTEKELYKFAKYLRQPNHPLSYTDVPLSNTCSGTPTNSSGMCMGNSDLCAVSANQSDCQDIENTNNDQICQWVSFCIGDASCDGNTSQCNRY